MKNVMTKAFAVITAASLTLTASISAYAAKNKFPDVTNENYPWAIDAIESMADDGIVKGYEDGTFLPAKTVSKLESLVMISRILGTDAEENERIKESSWDIYGDDVAQYELPYGEEEIAYLLVKGILTTDELEEYIGEDNRDDALKRYEVATLLTKALDAEKSIKTEIIGNLEYIDNSDIPANAKKYVAYVSEIGLMQGMEDNRFAPNDTVTRAQASLVLYKLQSMTEYNYKTGVVFSTDSTSRVIKVKSSDETVISHYMTGDVILRYNGKAIGVNDVSVGYDAVLTYKDGKLYAIDFTDALVDDVIYGSYVSSSTSTAKGTTVSLYVIKEGDNAIDTSEKTTFKLADNCVITYNGNTCSASSLKSGSYVMLTVKKGLVTVVEASAKESKISGRIEEITLEPSYKLRIEATGGEMYDSMVSSDVKVTRNGKTATARDILVGDSVSVTLNYGIVTSVVAQSRSSEKSGIIKEVIISATPKLTLDVGGEEITYYVTSDAAITLSDKEADFYDLRVGMSAVIKLDSDTVVSIKSVLNDDIITWAGTVTLVNSSYGLIQMEFVDPTTAQKRSESIFVNSDAAILDYETQKAKKLSAITPGTKINVTGSMKTGVFEARTIIILG